MVESLPLWHAACGQVLKPTTIFGCSSASATSAEQLKTGRQVVEGDFSRCCARRRSSGSLPGSGQLKPREARRTTVGTFVEIQRDVVVGANCKISSHSFLCSGVTIEDGVFIGHGVMFTNDTYPSSVNPDGSMQAAEDWTVYPRGLRCASIQQRHFLCGIVVGEDGAGRCWCDSYMRNVPPDGVVAGVPAKVTGDVRKHRPRSRRVRRNGPTGVVSASSFGI